MSGHSRWSRKPLENVHVDELGLQYAAGYILALEDLLKDISELRPQTEDEPVDGQTPYPAPCTRAYRLGQIHTMKEIQKRAGWSLHQARQTLEAIAGRLNNV